jgi:hypothetical protein
MERIQMTAVVIANRNCNVEHARCLDWTDLVKRGKVNARV